MPAGSFTVDRHGNVMTTTVGSEYPQRLLDDIAREVLSLFREARAAQMPLTGLDLNFASLHITAREMQGGAIIFLSPQNTFAASVASRKDTTMSAKRLDQLIAQIETHIECWKQFNHFVNLARAKKFGPEDESHFLELKSIIAQDLEMIFASIEVSIARARRKSIALIGHAPSLRYLSEMGEGDLRGIENAWHKIYIGWHSILGQLKIKQRTGRTSFFGQEKIDCQRANHSASADAMLSRLNAVIMLNYFQILILALIQGACELLPVSSSAHVIAAGKTHGTRSVQSRNDDAARHAAHRHDVRRHRLFLERLEARLLRLRRRSFNGLPSKSSSRPFAPASSAMG